MKSNPPPRGLHLKLQTLRVLRDVQMTKDLPAATTLSTCIGGCKANSRICSL